MNHLTHPDAALFDEAAAEVMLDHEYRPKDVDSFDDEQTYRFHCEVKQVVREKLAGLRDSPVLFRSYNS